MFIGKITYRESFESVPQKLEVKHSNARKLMEIISRFDDLDILEVHIYREA